MPFHELSRGFNPLLVTAVLVAFAVPSLSQEGVTASATSSSPANAAYVPTMTFEIASVRENKDIGPGLASW